MERRKNENEMKNERNRHNLHTVLGSLSDRALIGRQEL
jgi:hypothetical protein